MAIEVGKPAPAFTLTDAEGRSVSLADFRGRWVVLYFYPKDDTPGCTKEACGFRDLHARFEELGAVVLGVSPDPAPSHARFREKYGLPFRLLSDPEHRVLELYGAWGTKRMYGKERQGVVRSTVLIDPEGRVARHWPRVRDAAAHPAEVLAALEEATRGGPEGGGAPAEAAGAERAGAAPARAAARRRAGATGAKAAAKPKASARAATRRAAGRGAASRTRTKKAATRKKAAARPKKGTRTAAARGATSRAGRSSARTTSATSTKAASRGARKGPARRTSRKRTRAS